MKLKNACKGWWIAALAAGADRLTKIWAPAHPAEISGVVRFRPALLNSGVAFSFLENAGWVLTALVQETYGAKIARRALALADRPQGEPASLTQRNKTPLLR